MEKIETENYYLTVLCLLNTNLWQSICVFCFVYTFISYSVSFKFLQHFRLHIYSFIMLPFTFLYRTLSRYSQNAEAAFELHFPLVKSQFSLNKINHYALKFTIFSELPSLSSKEDKSPT